MDPAHLSRTSDIHATRLLLRVFARPHGSDESEFQPIIDRVFDWNDLVFVCNDVHLFLIDSKKLADIQSHFPNNTVLLEFEDGFYMLDNDESSVSFFYQ